MKRRLLYMGIAFTMAFSNISIINTLAAVDNSWVSDWTGKDGSSNFTITATQDNIVVIENTKANNGKFTDDEDSIIYYAKQLSNEDNFTLSATLTIDEYNTLEESSNPQQGSVGIAVLDSLYHKTDEISYDDGLFLGTYAPSKADSHTIRSISRNNSDKKVVSDPLSDAISNQGANLGSFDLSITKEDDVYTLTCGDNSTTIEMTALEDEIYPCLYIARNVKATFSNVSLITQSRRATSIELSGDYKKSYLYGEALDLSGLNATIFYDNDTKEETTSYLVKGYNPKKIGKQTITISKGSASANIEVSVKNLEVNKLNVDFAPIKTDYAYNDLFKSEGIQVSAEYSNGTTSILNPDQYYFTLDNNKLEPNDKLIGYGQKQIKVMRTAEEGITTRSNGHFYVNISKSPVSEITLKAPNKTTYYLGDELDTTGIVVKSTYKNNAGKVVESIIQPQDYTISGFDTTSVGNKTITITSKSNPEAKAAFEINVYERQAEKLIITKYPRTTYAIGEDFDPQDMVVAISYDNGDIETTNAYAIDKSAFDNAKSGDTSIIIEADGFDNITLPITIVDTMDTKWRDTIFGQSSGYDKGIETIGTIADNPGTTQGKINIKAWNGAGKITADHDGIAYYFTDIAGNSDFKISADITVVKYLEHNNDDTKRNGQEAFGIMARDVIPLEDSNNGLTIDPTGAKLDADGYTVPQINNKVFASNIAILGGYSGTGWPSDPTSASYERNTKLNRINLMVRQGVTSTDGGGERVGPYALSTEFPKEGNKYKLTLERLNGGLYAKCYDYQSGETIEQYYYDDSFLTVQNKDVAYIGFFASRWAEIDVENVEFYETNKATDQVIAINEAIAQTPAMYFRDKTYSTNPEYKFKLDVDDSHGTVTIKMNNKIIAQDEPITNISEFTATLKTNSINKLVAVYTPSDSLNLTSYEPIIIRENIYHKSFDASSGTIYASTDGSFSGNGSIEKPFDIDTAIGLVAPGQTLILKEGVYKRTKPIEVVLGDNGRANNLKKVFAEDGKKVVIDSQGITAGGILGGDYWHLKGIDFINSAPNQKGFHLGGSNNIIEACKFYDNQDMGFQISRIGSSQATFDSWPANNLILECESYNNCDPAMINADGFGAKLTVGDGNIFRDCKSHHNLDDGWDLYTKVGSGAIGVVTLENCISYKNGWKLNADGTETKYESGGHNGFKAGGENVSVNHKFINCIAYGNGNNGITTNSNPAITLINVTSYDNEGCNVRLYSDKPQEFNYTVEGISSYNGGDKDVIATVTQNTDFTNNSETPLLSAINYWSNAKDTLGVNVNNEVINLDK